MIMRRFSETGDVMAAREAVAKVTSGCIFKDYLGMFFFN